MSTAYHFQHLRRDDGGGQWRDRGSFRQRASLLLRDFRSGLGKVCRQVFKFTVEGRQLEARAMNTLACKTDDGRVG